jgi:hypothetical protein
MTSYSLSALLKIREQKKSMAEVSLKEAINDYEMKKQKLKNLQLSLQDSIASRIRLQRDFFLKAQRSPFNQREVSCHVSSSQKNLMNENYLRHVLQKQRDMVRLSSIKLGIAQNSVIEAKKNLQVLEKHYASWQQCQNHIEEIKKDHENDEHNCARFTTSKTLLCP